MEKSDDPITVGRITLPYSHLLNGWLMPDGTLSKILSGRRTKLSALTATSFFTEGHQHVIE